MTDTDTILTNNITLGTRRQYAEQSKAWANGEGRSEDQHLQRIWNLADDSLTLIDYIDRLEAEMLDKNRLAVEAQTQRDDYRRMVDDLQRDDERRDARVAALEEALRVLESALRDMTHDDVPFTEWSANVGLARNHAPRILADAGKEMGVFDEWDYKNALVPDE